MTDDTVMTTHVSPTNGIPTLYKMLVSIQAERLLTLNLSTSNSSVGANFKI